MGGDRWGCTAGRQCLLKDYLRPYLREFGVCFDRKGDE